MMWRRLDAPGHDWARLFRAPSGPVLRGPALFLEEGLACRLDYRIECDDRWLTRRGRVQGWVGERKVVFDIRRQAGARWTLNGSRADAVEGCEDLDLAFSPATNLFAIRRLALGPGQEGQVRSAWLRFPELDLAPLAQWFRRDGPETYAYRSDTGFATTLTVDGEGFVTDYPPFWRREPAGPVLS